MGDILDRSQPDRGYAWIILGLTWVVHLLGSSTSIAFSVFYPWILENLGTDHLTTSALTLAVTTSKGFAGLLLGPTIKKYGSRPVAMVTCAVQGCSLILCGLLPSIPLYFLTLAIIPGVCMGGQKMTAITACQEYFHKHRALALGVSTTAIGIATLVYGPLTAWLLLKVDWCGTLLIEGSIHIFGFFVSIFLFPATNNESEETLIDKRWDYTDSEVVGCCQASSSVCRSTGCHYWTHYEYLVFWFGMMFNQIGHGTPQVYLPVRGIDLGLTLTDAALLVSVTGISTTLARLLFGFSLDLECIRERRVYVLGITSTLNGVCTVICSMTNNINVLYTYAALYGVLSAYYTILQFMTLTDLYGSEDASLFVGHVQAAIGLSRIILNLLSGVLLDRTKDTSLPFLSSGIFQTMGGLMLFVTVLYRVQHLSYM